MGEMQVVLHDGIAVLTLNRPPVNALNTPFLASLGEALEGLEDDSRVRALVLTGAGKAFSAGLDLKEVPSYTVEEQKTLIRTLGTSLGRLYAFPRPTVAAINGHAIAGGLILVLATDHRLAAAEPGAEPKFGLTEVQVGIPFPAAAMAVVTAELAPAAARTLTLGAALHPAAEALAMGVVDALCPAAELMPRALETARRLAKLPAATYARVKTQLRRPALDRIEKSEREDPLLEDWLG